MQVGLIKHWQPRFKMNPPEQAFNLTTQSKAGFDKCDSIEFINTLKLCNPVLKEKH
jgi:hypothetical protein